MDGSAFSAVAVFVAAALGLTVLALAFVLAPMWRTRGERAASPRSLLTSTLREHARELDADLAAGRLDAAAHAAARADLERRLLEEAGDERAVAEGKGSERRAPRAVSIAIALAVPAIAAGLYALLGEPDALGLRNASSMPAPMAEGRAGRAELRAYVDKHPRDGRGWVLLARAEAARENFAVAAQAYERALALPRVAGDAGVWCEYADAYAMAQGGTLAGRPAELIAKALALNPDHPQALEMAGSAAYEARDFAKATTHWRALHAQIDPASAESHELAAAIARAERLAATALQPTLAASGSKEPAR